MGACPTACTRSNCSQPLVPRPFEGREQLCPPLCRTAATRSQLLARLPAQHRESGGKRCWRSGGWRGRTAPRTAPNWYLFQMDRQRRPSSPRPSSPRLLMLAARLTARPRTALGPHARHLTAKGRKDQRGCKRKRTFLLWFSSRTRVGLVGWECNHPPYNVPLTPMAVCTQLDFRRSFIPVRLCLILVRYSERHLAARTIDIHPRGAV